MSSQCPKCNSENLDDSKFCKECGTQLISLSFTKTLKAPTPLSTGKTIAGKYKILKELGRGGMGVVYKAQDTRLDRTVALKFLSSELTRDEEARKRFIHEAKAAAALEHPNICTVHEIEEADDQTFIAMSYLEGKSLKERLKSGPLGIDEALDIASQVAEGLREAHAKGIVHRDIKPANIMLTAKGQAKITDFGLAKLSWGADLTKTSAVMGTVAYMSPEQAKGEAVDHRTDIWSFGVVLHEMLTGALPFKGEHEQSLMYAIMNQEPLPLMKGRPDIPKEVENIVHTALAKYVADRYQSFEDILEDLQAVAQGLKPIKARRRPSRARILGLRKIHFFAGLITLFLIAAAVMLFFLPRGDDVLDSVAILPLINASGDPNLDNLAFVFLEDIITKLYQIRSLTVVPRLAVMPYQKSDKSPQQIARELGVKALVEASLQKYKENIQLTARIIDPFHNRIISNHELKKNVSEVLILQGEFALAIAKSIKVAITPDEEYRLATGRPVIPEAYDLYVQGFNFRADFRFQEAIDSFERAINIDPSFAPAYFELGNSYTSGVVNGHIPAEDAYAKAEKAVLRALEIDENYARAHTILAFLKVEKNKDYKAAEKEYKRALEIAPGDLMVRIDYYEHLVWSAGKCDEAIEGVRDILMRNPKSRAGIRKLPIYLLAAGYYQEALIAAEKSASVDPNLLYSSLAASALALMGRHEEAVSLAEEIRASPEYQKNEFPNTYLQDYACILALAGRRQEAHEKLEELESLLTTKNLDSYFDSACVYAALGEKDEAFLQLERAQESQSGMMTLFRSYWWLHSLHDDPRFEYLLKKRGLPEVQPPTKAK